MAVPTPERHILIDELTLLREIGGPQAEALAAHQAELLSTEPARHVPDDPAVSAGDKAAFEAACRNLAIEASNRLTQLVRTVPVNVLFSLPVLLGQGDEPGRSVSAGAGPYTSETELLATLQTAPPAEPSVENVAAAFRSLALARRVLHLRHLAGTRDSNRLAGRLVTGTTLVHGRFYGYYDLIVAGEVRSRLVAHGHDPEEPAAAEALKRLFLRRWTEALGQFFQEARTSARLLRLLRSHALFLSDQNNLTDHEFTILTRHIAGMWLTEEDVKAAPDVAYTDLDIQRWVQLLTWSGVPRTDGASALLLQPMLRVGDQLLLALPHRLDTDLTAILHSLWSNRYGEDYFHGRGAVVEEITFNSIADLPQAQSISAAMYRSADGSTEAECDGVILWRDLCIIIEAKGGFISESARRGSHDAAVKDLHETLGEAYYQAFRLVRVLEQDKSVTLHRSSEALTIVAEQVRKVYVVVPTADDFGAVATEHALLMAESVWPQGASPLVVSAQEMLLIRDLLPEPLSFVSYLEFREEIATAKAAPRFTDEHEMLGAFVAGIDPLFNEHRLANLETGVMLIPDPVLQRHVNKWLRSRYGDGPEKRPRRHAPEAESVITEFAERTQILEQAVWAMCAPGDGAHGAALSLKEPAPASREPKVYRITGFATVLARPTREARKAKGRLMRRLSRQREVWWLTFLPGLGGRLESVLRDVPGVPNHKGLLPRVDPKLATHWYERTSARRGPRSYDAGLVAALETEGLLRDEAVAVARRRLSARVRSTSGHGIAIRRSATTWLGEMTTLAREIGVSTFDLGIADRLVADAIRVIDSHRLDRSQALDVLRAAHGGESPADFVGRTFTEPPLGDEEIARRAVAVVHSYPEHARAAAAGNRKKEQHLLGFILKECNPKPTADRVARALSEALGGLG
ncbi:hypothetical protein ACI79G_09990 [Geodermatophilus sp. SYSU D00779]